MPMRLDKIRCFSKSWKCPSAAFFVASVLIFNTSFGGEIQGQFIVTNLPKVQSQHRTPWCFAFASRTVLAQHLCSGEIQCQNQDLGDIGLGDIIEVGVAEKMKPESPFSINEEFVLWFAGGEPASVLEKISSNGRIMKASCASERDLFSFHTSEKTNAAKYPLHFQLEILFAGFQAFKLTHPNSTNASAEFLANYQILTKYPGSLRFIEKSLSLAKTKSEFVRKIMMPENCSQKILSFRHFDVKKFTLKDPVQIEKNFWRLQELL